MYKLTNYDSFYQEKVHDFKKKGTGVALYTHNSLKAVQSSQVSKVSENLDTLFVTLTNSNTPITIGVLYRPPNGDIDKALSEQATILDDLPQHSYVAGDFNIDLHQSNNKYISELENITMSRGFLPLISTVTHEKPGCKGSCIDNFITNDIENILLSGTISEKISHHFPIFQTFKSNLEPIPNERKYVQYYDYCNSNI